MRTSANATPRILFLVTSAFSLLTGCATPELMNQSGMGYYKGGAFAMAANEFRTALESDPGNADYALNYGMALHKAGNIVAAEKMYQRAIKANPGHMTAYHEYSQLLVAQNRQPEAMALMDENVAINGYEAAPHAQLAQLHRDNGNRSAEYQTLQTALKSNPRNPEILAQMGQYFQDMGERQAAIRMYRKSLQANGNQSGVQTRLAGLQGQVQQEKQAVAKLARLQQEQVKTAQKIQTLQTRTAQARQQHGTTRIARALPTQPINVAQMQVPHRQVAVVQQVPQLSQQVVRPQVSVAAAQPVMQYVPQMAAIPQMVVPQVTAVPQIAAATQYFTPAPTMAQNIPQVAALPQASIQYGPVITETAGPEVYYENAAPVFDNEIVYSTPPIVMDGGTYTSNPVPTTIGEYDSSSTTAFPSNVSSWQATGTNHSPAHRITGSPLVTSPGTPNSGPSFVPDNAIPRTAILPPETTIRSRQSTATGSTATVPQPKSVTDSPPSSAGEDDIFDEGSFDPIRDVDPDPAHTDSAKADNGIEAF